MILSKKSKKNTTKLMVHLPHLKLIFIIQNCLSDMEKSLLKQSCLNITRKRGRQHYTNCIVFLLIWFFASSIFLKQKNKRNAVKSTFLPLLSTAADRNRTSADTQEPHRKGDCATSADSCTRFVQLFCTEIFSTSHTVHSRINHFIKRHYHLDNVS